MLPERENNDERDTGDKSSDSQQRPEFNSFTVASRLTVMYVPIFFFLHLNMRYDTEWKEKI